MAAPATKDYNQQLTTQPALPPGTQFTPNLQSPQAGEFLNQQYDVNANGTIVDQTATGQHQQAASVSPQDAASYNAATVGDAAQGTAAQGTLTPGSQVQAEQGTLSEDTLQAIDEGAQVDEDVDPRSLMQNQYAELMDFEAGEIPGWAKAAYKQAMQDMANRGFAGASTMMGEAITTSLMQAAMPIASQDAKVFQTMQLKKLDLKAQSAFMKAGYLAQMDMANLNNRQQAAVLNAQNFLQMDLANLNNRQQMSIVNTQARQQVLLSNQAAENAALQFNANSENQMTQFYDKLAQDISMFNAAQKNEMERYNAGQQNATAQFNQRMVNQREQFNVNNQMVVDQANAQWLRQINTQNSSLLNQANYVNSQNLLNISNTAMANAIQLYRDEMSYEFTASENSLNRAENRALMLLQKDLNLDMLDEQNKQAFGQSLGQFVFGIFDNLFSD